jgi:hypothetical protein
MFPAHEAGANNILIAIDQTPVGAAERTCRAGPIVGQWVVGESNRKLLLRRQFDLPDGV